MDPVTLAVGAGLASAASWGAADFAGGLAARRTHNQRGWSRPGPAEPALVTALAIALVVQLVGLVVLVAVALAVGEPVPAWTDLAWGAAAGISGVTGLVALYRALSEGRMGVAASVTGVIAAVIPVMFGMATEGAPRTLTLGGFGLALAGIALVSAEGAGTSRRSLLFAVVSGMGFGGFLVLISRTSGDAFLWPLVAVRIAGGLLVGALLLATYRRGSGARFPWRLVLAAGVLDTGGNVFFLAAERLGRLDVAAVLSSLYPAATLVLARGLLGERLMRGQWVGVGAILAAIVMVAWP